MRPKETLGNWRSVETVNKISANGKILVTDLLVGYLTESNDLNLLSDY